MTSTTRRAARFRHLFLFVTMMFQGANLAYSTSPDLSLSATTFDFKYISGGALPASQTLNVKSTGTAFNFTIPAITTPWLSVSANSGATGAAIKVYVNPTSMASGSYTGSIIVNAPTAVTTTMTVTVTMEISDPTPTLTASTTTLNFTYATDQATPTPSQQVVLTSSGGAVSTTITVAGGGTWLSAVPSGTISLAGIPATVVVSVNPTGLAVGSVSGTVKITPTDKTITPITVSVSLQVKAGTPTVTALWPPGVQAGSGATTVTVTGTNFFATSTVATGSTKITGVTFISPTVLLVTLPASLLTTAGSLPITVTTLTAVSSSATSAASTFQVYGPGPQIFTVADAASYAQSNISPGEIITIFGVGLGPNVLVPLTVSDPLATSLPSAGAATKVTINGEDAPLLYASATQVSCIVPFDLASQSGNQVDVSVTYAGVAAAKAVKVNVVDANPGLFSMDSSGSGQGAILNFNPATFDYSINSATNPAIKGTTIAVLYLTGAGATDCVDVPASANFAGSDCKSNATELNLISGAVTPHFPISVTIDGQPAPNAQAQAPIGSVPGLMQVNVPVPAGVSSKPVLVVVTVGSGATQVQSQGKITMVVK